MHHLGPNQEPTLRDVCLDVAISAVLVAGTGLTEMISQYFFPKGTPFPLSLILAARDAATLFWAIGISVYYFMFTYRSINRAFSDINRSSLWQKSVKNSNRLARSIWSKGMGMWRSLNAVERRLLFLIVIILCSFGIFTSSHNLFDLWMPIIFFSVSFGFAFGVEKLSSNRMKTSTSFWLVIVLLFLLVLLLANSGLLPDAITGHSVNIGFSLGEVRDNLLITHLSRLRGETLVEIMNASGINRLRESSIMINLLRSKWLTQIDVILMGNIDILYSRTGIRLLATSFAFMLLLYLFWNWQNGFKLNRRNRLSGRLMTAW